MAFKPIRIVAVVAALGLVAGMAAGVGDERVVGTDPRVESEVVAEIEA